MLSDDGSAAGDPHASHRAAQRSPSPPLAIPRATNNTTVRVRRERLAARSRGLSPGGPAAASAPVILVTAAAAPTATNAEDDTGRRRRVRAEYHNRPRQVHQGPTMVLTTPVLHREWEQPILYGYSLVPCLENKHLLCPPQPSKKRTGPERRRESSGAAGSVAPLRADGQPGASPSLLPSSVDGEISSIDHGSLQGGGVNGGVNGGGGGGAQTVLHEAAAARQDAAGASGSGGGGDLVVSTARSGGSEAVLGGDTASPLSDGLVSRPSVGGNPLAATTGPPSEVVTVSEQQRPAALRTSSWHVFYDLHDPRYNDWQHKEPPTSRPATSSDRWSHCFRRLCCLRCAIASQTVLLHEEEQLRRRVPHEVCNCCLGASRSWESTFWKMLLLDALTLGACMPLSCLYQGAGTALYGWRLRYLMRRRFSLKGTSAADFLLMLCAPFFAVDQQGAQMMVNGMYEVGLSETQIYPPAWYSMS